MERRIHLWVEQAAKQHGNANFFNFSLDNAQFMVYTMHSTRCQGKVVRDEGLGGGGGPVRGPGPFYELGACPSSLGSDNVPTFLYD